MGQISYSRKKWSSSERRTLQDPEEFGGSWGVYEEAEGPDKKFAW